MTRECRKYAGRIFRIQPVDVTYEKVEGGLDVTGFLGTVADALGVNPVTVTRAVRTNAMIHGKYAVEPVEKDYWSSNWVYHAFEAVRKYEINHSLRAFEGSVEEICEQLHFEDVMSVMRPYGKGELILNEYLMTEVEIK